MAPQAEPLAEVVRGAAAGYAGWWREGAAGQALVAEVDLGSGPLDHYAEMQRDMAEFYYDYNADLALDLADYMDL